jgi:hypothetical protein
VSRSGYCDELEPWALIRWRGAVASAIRGKRGQAFLGEMRAALDAIPDKRLVANELEVGGEVCAIGAVGKVRGLDMTDLDPDEPEEVAQVFGIPRALASEVVYENDEGAWRETPEQRWQRMRAWIVKHLRPATPTERADPKEEG